MRTYVAVFVFVFVCALQLGRSSLAFADALPIDECSTKQKKEGEACKDYAGKDGACGKISFTSYNHATDPPTPSDRTYFGCRTGEKATKPADGKKGCSAAPVDGKSGLEWLTAAAIVLVARRRRARC